MKEDDEQQTTTAEGPQAEPEERPTALERVLAEDQVKLRMEELVCDLRDTMLQVIKDRPKPWGKMKEEEQRDLAAGLENFSEQVIASIVTLVASRGLDPVQAKLDKFTGKGGEYQITLKAVGGPEFAMKLAQLDNHQVLVVSSDHAPFYGMTPAQTEPDQPPLDFDEEEPQGAEVELGEEPEPVDA